MQNVRLMFNFCVYPFIRKIKNLGAHIYIYVTHAAYLDRRRKQPVKSDNNFPVPRCPLLLPLTVNSLVGNFVIVLL